MSSQAASGSQNPRQVFKDAQNRFLESLGPEDRALYSPCASSEDFAAAVKSLESEALNKDRRVKSFKCIYSFSKRLEPFFQVINIFIQADPQYSALVWGAFRLVLQLSCSITTFFGKLLALLDQLLAAFPRYEDILNLCNNDNSERIRKNVEDVYVDVLNIFQAGIRVSTRSSGKLKPTPLVLGELLWRPFDVRFKDFIDKMAVHQHNISEEIRVWQFKRDDKNSAATAEWRQYVRQELEDAEQERQAIEKERVLMAEERRQNTQARANISALLSEFQDAKLALEKQRIEAAFIKLKERLRPTDYVDTREKISKARLGPTAVWIVDHAKYRFWRDEKTRPHPDGNQKKFGPSLIWLNGHPGAGKSVLATLILDTLDEENAELPERSRHFVLYHFFKFDDFRSISPADAFRSMASQILSNSRHDKDIVDKFSFIMESKTQGQLDPSEETLLDILLVCIDHRTVIVVDGIDECSESDSFVSSLLKVSHTCQAKILFLSRINVPRLQRAVRKESQLELPKNELSKDIRRFLKYELNDLIDEEILPESALEQIDTLTEHLVKGADGMFLWARLMTEYLRSSTFSPNRRMKIISEINFPEGLEKMYNRIFMLISQSGRSSKDLATEVLIWLTFNASQMSSSQMRQALTVEGLWSSDNENENINVFENAVLMACKGLVQTEPISDASNGLRFIHLTVKEILTTPLPSANILASPLTPNCIVMPNSQIANLRLAFCCLRQLIYHTPPEPLSGQFNKSISSAELAQKLPFTDYASLYWMEHLSATSKSNPEIMMSKTQIDASFEEAFVRFAPELKRFLSTPKSITAWLEAYYTSSNNARPSGAGIHRWASWLSELAQETNLRVEGSLLGLLFGFQNDLDRVVSVWGNNLQFTPHTIWDEAFALGPMSRNVFFSPDSTKAKAYTPEIPEGYGEAIDVLFVKSAVSSDGLMLGVLSLWHIDKSLRQLVVSYELWPLESDSTRLLRIIRHINLGWLTISITGGNSSIASDALSFSVINTVWRLFPDPSTAARGLAQGPWQEPIQIKSKVIGEEILNINFHPCGKYIITVVDFRLQMERLGKPGGREEHTEPMILLAYELTSDLDMILYQILQVGSKEQRDLGIQAGLQKAPNICFQPNLPLCVLWGKGSSIFYYWNFNRGPKKELTQQRINFSCVDASFSECGTYLVLKSEFGGVTVLNIPVQHNSQGSSSDPNYAELSEEAILIAQMHRDGTNRHSEGVQLQQLGERPPRGLSAMIGQEKAIALSTQTSRDGVHLAVSQVDRIRTDVFKPVTMPIVGDSEFNAEIQMSKETGDSARIIPHPTPHLGNQCSIVVEREPKFFAHSSQLSLRDSETAVPSKRHRERYNENPLGKRTKYNEFHGSESDDY